MLIYRIFLSLEKHSPLNSDLKRYGEMNLKLDLDSLAGLSIHIKNFGVKPWLTLLP